MNRQGNLLTVLLPPNTKPRSMCRVRPLRPATVDDQVCTKCHGKEEITLGDSGIIPIHASARKSCCEKWYLRVQDPSVAVVGTVNAKALSRNQNRLDPGFDHQY